MREWLDQYMPPNYSAHGGELDALNDTSGEFVSMADTGQQALGF